MRVRPGDVSFTLIIAGRLVSELMAVTICFLVLLVDISDSIEGFGIKKKRKGFVGVFIEMFFIKADTVV